MKLKLLGILFLTATVFYIGCRKTDRDEDVIVFASIDNAKAENVFSKIFLIVHEYAMEDTLLVNLHDTLRTNKMEACIDSITMLTTNGGYPKYATFHYPTAGLACDDGALKSGSFTARFSGPYHNLQSNVKITFANFTYDAMEVGGTLVTNYNRVMDSGDRKYSFEVKDGLLSGDSIAIVYNSLRSMSWEGGRETSSVDDDTFAYWMGGTINGRTTSGNDFIVNVTEALRFSKSCENVYSGTCDVTPSGLSKRSVDYGSSCDLKMNVTINGVTTELTVE